MNEAHTIQYCECGEALESRLIQNHKSNLCTRRIVTCEYCPLQMPYVEKYEHEQKCGSQTQKCEKCKKYIMKKDATVHTIDCETLNTPYYYSSSPTHSFTTPQNKRQGEEVMLCPTCMTPFVHFDDLEVHMISSHENVYGADSQTSLVENKELTEQ